jgi:hypothetical protein
MVAQTYVDAVGAVRAWINGRTATLVGLGHPLQKGAHFKRLDGAAGRHLRPAQRGDIRPRCRGRESRHGRQSAS